MLNTRPILAALFFPAPLFFAVIALSLWSADLRAEGEAVPGGAEYRRGEATIAAAREDGYFFGNPEGFDRKSDGFFDHAF